MNRHLRLCVLIGLTLGCKGNADAPDQRTSIVEPNLAEEAPPPGEPRGTKPPVVEAELGEAAPSAAELDVTAIDEPAEAATPVVSARDLGAELRTAVGSPADCIRDFQPISPRTIRVEIRAVVRPTGMVIEPSADGTGLSRNDRRCIEERVGAIVLDPLAGQASQTVSTAVEVTLTPPTPSVQSDEVAPPPQPAEGVVLPLPKKEPIEPSGQPIEGPAPDPIEGPDGVPIDGPKAVPIEGPAAVPNGTE